MQFLSSSLVELITQTSTNLPPDVRQAMGMAMGAEQAGTQAAQALSVIATNIDYAQEDASPICQDTGMPTFHVHTPVGVNQLAIARRSARRWPRRPSAASYGRTRWTRSPVRTAATIWAKRLR
ncbi:MAG: fumarate hydratase [Bryobacteraceae bacterium]